MDKEQWEALCDGCGKCCLLKLEDFDTGEVHYTNVGCKLLDCTNARCIKYSHRKNFVPDCISLSPDNIELLAWMPKTCSYRLVAEGKDLPYWHPLITGDPKSTVITGHSVVGNIFSEHDIDENDLPFHITEFD